MSISAGSIQLTSWPGLNFFVLPNVNFWGLVLSKGVSSCHHRGLPYYGKITTPENIVRGPLAKTKKSCEEPYQCDNMTMYGP